MAKEPNKGLQETTPTIKEKEKLPNWGTIFPVGLSVQFPPCTLLNLYKPTCTSSSLAVMANLAPSVVFAEAPVSSFPMIGCRWGFMETSWHTSDN